VLDLTPDEWTAIALSLRIALVATAVGLPFGVAVAWLLARKDFWGKSLFDGIIHLPLVLPPVVTGYLLLITFGRRGLIGAFLADYLGIVLSFRWTGAALACGIMGFPLLVRPICFAKALGEFGATITFVSNIPGETQTISAAIYTLTQSPGGDAAAGRLVLVAIAISLVALVLSEWLARRAGMRFHGE